MRGGAQSHLMRCSDGNYYVVKFQNNPQHRRVLVNELLGTRLASRLGLPTTPLEVIYVSPELIRLTPDLCIELPRSRTPCVPGLQFGSRYPGDPLKLTLHDFLPDEKLREVENLHDFAGMLVFDKWTCNTNGRQTLFFEENKRGTAGSPRNLPVPSPGSGQAAIFPYKTVMIDQGFCFNAGNWDFPDAPLRGLYARNRVYDSNEARDGRTCAYRVLRYTPNLVRDEWVNIGVLVFDPQTGERRLRMIEEPLEPAARFDRIARKC